MAIFDDREASFEAKFAHDQQLQFRAEAKACKLFGVWVATEMGLVGDAVTHYAHDMVVANLDEPGLEDVIDKAEQDLKATGRVAERADLKRHLDVFYAQAKTQIMDTLT